MRSNDSQPADRSADSGPPSAPFAYLSEPSFLGFLGEVVKRFQGPLQDYLMSRGVRSWDAEETVQAFFSMQLTRRTAIARLYEFRQMGSLNERGFGYLKACVLHTHCDARRANRQTESLEGTLPAFQANETDAGIAPFDQLHHSWAVAMLQNALHDLRAEVVGSTRPESTLPTPAATAIDLDDSPADRALSWKIFHAKFFSGPITTVQRERPVTTHEIAKRFKLSRDQVNHRLRKLRKLLTQKLKQTLRETCPHEYDDALYDDVLGTLIADGVCLPDLWPLDPEHHPPGLVSGSGDIFSADSMLTNSHDELIEMLISPEQSTQRQTVLNVWDWVLSRRILTSVETRSLNPTAGPALRTIRQVINAREPELGDLIAIKRMARNQGQHDHVITRQIYHLLYALVISKAKNIHGRTITSLPRAQRVQSLNEASRYEWIPTDIAQELEIATRTFLEPSTGAA